MKKSAVMVPCGDLILTEDEFIYLAFGNILDFPMNIERTHQWDASENTLGTWRKVNEKQCKKTN